MISDKVEINERIKALNEKALAAGRLFQSRQTGFVHYFHSMQTPSMHQAIPLYENLLFVLALLRSRLVDNASEAKDLLFRLLSFQCSDPGSEEGNFPFYLHDYPKGQEAESSLRLLAPLYWILKQFGHILGQELKKRVEKSLHALMEFSLKSHLSQPFPYTLSVRLVAAQQAYGELFGREDWKEEWLKDGHALAIPCDSWCSTAYLADLFVAIQMGDRQDHSLQLFWEFVYRTWHQGLGCYIGPCVREWQSKEIPQANLYDLFLGFFFNQAISRTEPPAIYHLQAALIQPVIPSFPEREESYSFSGLYKGKKWTLYANQKYAWTGLDKENVTSPIGEKTYTPFRFVTGSEKLIHTLVCQGGKFSKEWLNKEEGRVTLYFDLESPFEGEERTICFFWDDHPDWQVRVDGELAATFALGQTVSLQVSRDQTIHLVFELVEGEGQFLGHLAKGNRPSQLKVLEEEKHFQAYDRILFIRTIRRRTPCRLKVTIQIIF